MRNSTDELNSNIAILFSHSTTAVTTTVHNPLYCYLNPQGREVGGGGTRLSQRLNVNLDFDKRIHLHDKKFKNFRALLQEYQEYEFC